MTGDPDKFLAQRLGWVFAKGYASALAGFGGALLAALERRDGDALTRLRYEQGLVLARMTTRQRELDVQTADEGLSRQREAAAYRRDYYAALADEGRNVLEIAESTARQSAVALRREHINFGF